ncbi:hypothetical protein FA378_26595 [Pseudomonas aeruginosa]|nr:hypothetical protein [Pseudomonas aeruginosa]
MTTIVDFKNLPPNYSTDIATDQSIEKDTKSGHEAEGKVDPRIVRGEQLLASIQSFQGRGADQGNDINALANDALGLGNDILGNTPPSGSGSDSYLQGLKNLGVLNTGIVTMAAVMLLLQEHANATFEAMTTKTEISREAQDMANRVKAILAKLTKPEDTAALPPEVIQYLRENNITVEGKTIDEFLSGKDVNKLNQGDLKAVEMALESASGRASDFVQQTQLKLQQLMQNYNTAVQMTNSLQSMLAESVKSIASSIR